MFFPKSSIIIREEVANQKAFLDKERGLGREDIMFIGPYGSVNYGLFTEDSDVDTKAIYVPDLREAVLREHPRNIEFDAGKGLVLVKDIRQMNKMFLKGAINFLEILVSDYTSWNVSNYKKVLDEYIHFTNLIAFNNYNGVLRTTCGLALADIKRCRDATDIYKKSKIVSRLRFLQIYLNLYCCVDTYRDCFEYSGIHAQELRDFKEHNTDPVDEMLDSLEGFFLIAHSAMMTTYGDFFEKRKNHFSRELNGKSIEEKMNDLAYEAIITKTELK